MKKALTIVLASTVLVSGLSATDIIKGSGASFPYSVYQKWIKAYNKDTGIKVDYIKKGSSKGIKDCYINSSSFSYYNNISKRYGLSSFRTRSKKWLF